MATLHKTIDDAIKEAYGLMEQYRLVSSVVLKIERCYGENFEQPGFEAITYKELEEYRKHSRDLNIVAHVRKSYN